MNDSESYNPGAAAMLAAMDAAAPATESAPIPQIDRAMEQALDKAGDFNRKVLSTVDQIVAQQFDCVKLIGQMQAVDMFKKFVGTADAVLFRQVKESKAYRGMRVPMPDGSVKVLNTFEEFCELMGTSRRKADEDIMNLNVLGEAFMESAQKMGLGYRQLRQLRALPEEERQLVIEGEAVSATDPEALKDLLEELAAKRAKDKEALKEARANLDAKDKVLKAKNDTLDSVQTELAKLKNLPPDQKVILQGERETEALRLLHLTGFELIGAFGKYLARVRSLLDSPDVGRHAREQAVTLTSGLCSQIAEELLEAGVDIDFRILTYPAHLGDLPLRGDADETMEA